MSRTLGATSPPPVARLHGARSGLARRAAVVLAGALGVLGGASAVQPAPTAAAPALPGLPPPGALTMGADAGQTLVGVTLTPGTPGPNLVTVYLEESPGPGGIGRPAGHHQRPLAHPNPLGMRCHLPPGDPHPAPG